MLEQVSVAVANVSSESPPG